MINLKDLEQIKKLDPKDVYGSTSMFSDQCQQIVDLYFDKDFFPPEYKHVKNVVICGMGGSAYGGHVVNSLYANDASVPILVRSDYHLPSYVNKHTLVLLVSYSGSTEEVLSCAHDAVEKKAKIAGFSSGGKLGEFLKKKYPGFTFNPQFNPSGQPRLGTGYIVLGTLTLLKSAGIINLSKNEVLDAIKNVRSIQEGIKNEAMKLSEKILNHIPVIFAAEHLEGNAHILRNQFNETAKSFSAYSTLPELNHHLMEGLKNPENKKIIVFILNSILYNDVLQKRIELTKEVVTRNKIKQLEYRPNSKTKLAQVFEVLSFGGYLTLFTALRYGQDPSVIPWVDYFKKKLSK